MNATPSEVSAVLGVVNPANAAAAAYSTGWVDASRWERLRATIFAGVLGASATLNAKLEGGTTSSGGTTGDITGAAITQLTKAGSDDNKQAQINLNTDALAGTEYRYVRLTVTVAVATSPICAVLEGFGPKYSPASDNDATTVDEIVSV